jgi:ribosomal protein S18 acetylase RimI-like enzyme
MLRPATGDDLDFLWAMLGHASSPDGAPWHRHRLEADPELARYLDGWGRDGDVGVVAVDPASGERLGAGWYRSYPSDAPGFGFVDEATPELATALTAAARGQGLGHQLIAALLAQAHLAGVERLSLSVRTSNAAAVRVYEDEGFVDVAIAPDGLHRTMVAPTRPAPSETGRVVVRSVPPGGLDWSVLPPSEWGTVIARLGELVDLAQVPALVAEIDGAPAGLLTWSYDPSTNEVEVLGIEAWVRGRGVGAALLRAVRSEARRLGAGRLWLITNNDNVDALRFYQRRGWQLAALHLGGTDRSRAVKPSIPLVGDHGIPVHHEVELEFRLDP